MPIADLDTDQRHAATATGAEIAVSAGAGSGKTRLLVARYLRLIHQDGVPMEAIAAITFTKKAANQMKARIAKRAGELAVSDEQNRDVWQSVARDAHDAKVSTIHSFCSSILRQYPVEADIDPSFSVIDTVTDTELRQKVVRDLIAERLNEGGDDTTFILTTFGLPRYSQMLRELLGKRTSVIRCIDTAEHNGGLDAIAFSKRYEQALREQLESMIYRLEAFHALRPGDDGLTPVYDTVLAALTDTCEILDSERTVDCDKLAQAAQAISVRAGSKAKWGAETLADLKASLKECKAFLGILESYYRYDQRIVPKATSVLMRDYQTAESMYRQVKRDKGMLDNDDLLIETWRLMRSRYDVCRQVSASFRHILVDEFQDTDGLQMDILNMIAGNSSASLFTVGDPKQSIYRFRGADVTVFNRFIMGNHTTFVPLTTNYRSAPAVMDFVNIVFERLMGEEPSHRYEAMYRSMKTNRKESPVVPAVDITVIAGKSGAERRRHEAMLIADRIRDIVQSNIGYTYKDMAILLRTGAPLTTFEEVLLARGIPFVNRVGGKLAGSPEAFDIGNLLGWLADPDDPVLLVAVLMSPFFGISADALYALRCQAGTADAMPGVFHTLVSENPADPVLAELVPAASILTALAQQADRVTVRELLERAFDETGYTLVLAADPVEGDRSLAMIDLIVETAVQFERNGGTRKAFAELLRSGMPFTDETAQVETTGNAVSIMTIHGCKGLEFNVVFLADITGGGSRGGGLAFDDVLGPGFSVRDDRGGSRSTFPRQHILEIEKLKEEAESKRLFYVATTRARDVLNISGGAPAKNSDNGSGNWMTWLHAVLDLPRDGSADGMISEAFRYQWIEDEPVVISDAQASRVQNIVDAWAGASSDTVPVIPESLADVASFVAPLRTVHTSLLPDTISVSELLDMVESRWSEHPVEESMVINPHSKRAGMHTTGALYGTVFHAVLERIAFDTPEHWEETARMVTERILDAAPLRSTLLKDLKRFANTPLAQTLARSSNICREEPFGLLINDVLVRGAIDLMYEHDGELAIVDYKTGAVPDEDSQNLRRYRLQLAIYALAVWRATNQRPRRLTLAFVSHDKYLSFECTDQLLQDTKDRLAKTLEH